MSDLLIRDVETPPKDEAKMGDVKFMTHIIDEICNFAIRNNMEPDDILAKIADDILSLLEKGTFNHWTSTED